MNRKREVEERLFRGYWGDGLVDLLAGCALVSGGIGWYLMGPIAVVHVPIWLTLWGPLRRQYVEPHAGYVEFSQGRRARSEKQLRTVIAMGVGCGILMLMTILLAGELKGNGFELKQWVAGLPAGILMIMLVVAGILTGGKRFLAYAAAMGLSGLATIQMGLDPDTSLIMGSMAPLIGGALLWTRFRVGYREFEAGAAS